MECRSLDATGLDVEYGSAGDQVGTVEIDDIVNDFSRSCRAESNTVMAMRRPGGEDASALAGPFHAARHDMVACGGVL